MATATAARHRRPGVKETLYNWEGKDKSGRVIQGEMRAASESVVKNSLRRQGVIATKIKKQSMSRGHKVTEKDIALFTRQLATMMKAGVPMLQAFDIGIKGSGNPGVSRLLNEVRNEVEAGSSLAAAFSKFPLHFDKLFCNLVGAGEQAGILDDLLDRLATYKEKILAIKSKIKSALFYPTAIICVAFIVVAVIMLFVVPAFKSVFDDFGAELPGPTLVVMGISEFFVSYWYIIFGVLFGAIFGTLTFYKRSLAMQISVDRGILKLPVVGDIVRKATIARWTRTLSTMFAAGVPLTEALDSVGGAAGNHVYLVATRHIQNEVGAGTSLTNAMQNSHAFPSMVVQMVSIGEESGQLDSMLGKVADFYEQEVDDAVAALSSLLEPIIMVFLGVVIGGLVVAMYMPIFKLGAVV
ncbi:type II secretion system protein F [Betaproteobacteria bacterium]|nr:type II secretion system protein F [Betaproteobacteria bacterium]GHU28204.1 type II secretion system protein F [Betaproteobacteria bacterium]